MSSSLQPLKIVLNPEVYRRLEHFARDQQVSVEEAASSLIAESLHGKRHESVRILHPDKGEGSPHGDAEMLSDLIKRQDKEIAWLRDHIHQLSSVSPDFHIYCHDYPGTLFENPDDTSVSDGPGVSSPKKAEEKEIFPPESSETLPVSVDDVHYTPGMETGGLPGDQITSGFDGSDAAFQNPERVSDRTLRDSIGGVREEKKYSLGEAAAIAGESEAVLLEYILDGVLPATKDVDSYRIKGTDLRRYMFSK